MRMNLMFEMGSFNIKIGIFDHSYFSENGVATL